MKTLLAGLLMVGGTLSASALDLVTIDGEQYRNVGEITVAGGAVKVPHEAGVATIPLAALSEADLAKLAPADRSKDGKFWFERGVILYRALRTADPAKTPELEAQLKTLAPYEPIMLEYGQKLVAERKAAEVQQKKATAKRAEQAAKDQAARQWVEEYNRSLVQKYSTEAGIKELMRMGR